jgi:beta-lactamase regulating signal transducer with metallopeptidase domain
MNHLGILLAWSALQTTLLAVAAATAYLFAARRRPTVGAAAAAVGPCGAVLLTLLAVCPLPSWWNWQPPWTAEPAKPEATRVALPADAESSSPDAEPVALPAPSSGGGAALAWPVVLGRWTWEGAGRASAPFTDQAGNGWGIASIVFLMGAAICGLRLTFGLWAVSDLRRRSRPVADPPICLLMHQLRGETGYRSRVEVRESSSVGAPAVVGWLRPLVLLPADWRDWSDVERRAVMAHELAHVQRADYLLGLMARLGVALHFYHPLLHWLAGRLRLQQELAADALAAPYAGGRGPYLLALAGLALRLEDRRSAGWPANPMFSRGTLMRRIQMLKIKDGRFSKPVSRWGRALIVALAAVIVVGVSALRCPAQKGEGKPASERVKGEEKSSSQAAAPAAEVEPFDISYLPPDAMGAVAFRPAAVFGRPGLKKYADENNKSIAAVCKMYGLSRAFGLPIEEIAQVSATVRIGTDKMPNKTRNTLMLLTPIVIRSVKPFDWGKELKELIPGVTETRHGKQVVYKFPTDGPLVPLFGPKRICFFTPDGRTVVFDAEEDLDRLIDRKPGGDAPGWTKDFKRVERGIAAVVLDNRNGALSRELAARDNPEAAIAPFQKHTSWVVAGVSADKDLVCEAAVHFDGEEIAGKAMNEIDGRLAAARDALEKTNIWQVAVGDGSEAESPNIARATALQLLKNLLQKPELTCDGATIRLRCRAKCDFTELISAILGGGLNL